jgi:hypothetical protein
MKLFKNLLLLFLVAFATTLVDAQNINDKYAQQIESQETGIIPVKVGNKWKKLGTDDKRFNILRTPFGNVAGVDSSAGHNGLMLYKDSTVIAYAKIGTGTMGNGWDGTPTGKSGQLDVLGDFAAYEETSNQYGGITFNKGIGGVNLGFRPKRLKTGSSWGGVTINTEVINSNLGSLQNSPDGFSRSVVKFVTTFHDTTSNGSLNWPGKTRSYSQTTYPNLRLFSFIHGYGVNTHLLDIFPSRTEINTDVIIKGSIKISTLSYVPTSSTNLTAEAATAEIGTMWNLNVSGSWYLVTKISATKLARVAFAEW